MYYLGYLAYVWIFVLFLFLIAIVAFGVDRMQTVKVRSHRMLILSLLRDEEARASSILKRSGGKLKRGTVYFLLTDLERKGFVQSHKETDSHSVMRLRKLYSITTMGLACLDASGSFAGFVSGS